MKMKYIKLLREFFDTEELKAEFEIPTITGDLNFKQLAKDAPEFFKRDKTAFGLHDKLSSEFPFLDYCVYGGKEECGSDIIKLDDNEAIHYIFINKVIHLGLSVNKEEDEDVPYLVTIYYKYPEVIQTDDNLILCDGEYDGDDIYNKCILEYHKAKNIGNVINIIRNKFIPLMEDFEFWDILEDEDVKTKISMIGN